MSLAQKKNNKIAFEIIFLCVKKLPTYLPRSKPLSTVKNQIKTFLTILSKKKKTKLKLIASLTIACHVDYAVSFPGGMWMDH